MNKFLFIIVLVTNYTYKLNSQNINTKFNLQDTLRGTITKERQWWDLTYYHLDIEVKPEEKFISGKNTIQYRVIEPYQKMQIDLQYPMKIKKVIQDNEELNIESIGNAHFITLNKTQKTNTIDSLIVFYEGKPREAVRAPWDGGFSWKKDNNGKHFIATSCQGLGASVWWPNKDHMYDEVDSMLISVTHPKGLMNVSNGRLRKLVEKENVLTSHWFINNPINNYGVNVNIADYVNFKETYKGIKGNLDLDYWVLSYNLEKAKEHFKDAPKMMKAFEYWFGPYPFYEDSFKLVEVPYLGMEHQSSVTYGNRYEKGYLGSDLSRTGWGLKFDFIIIHEAGHEWFANNITNKDIADMWVHESFTAYSESLFLEYYYGKKAGSEYVIGTRRTILNDRPIIGQYNVNNEGSGDMYYKGANMLHTLRQLVDDDNLWHNLLIGLNTSFYHKTVTSKEIEDYISRFTNKDLNAFFNQYLRDIRIPTLEYNIENNSLSFRYLNIVENFDMPIRIFVNKQPIWIYPNNTTKSINIKSSNIKFDNNFLVHYKEIK